MKEPFRLDCKYVDDYHFIDRLLSNLDILQYVLESERIYLIREANTSKLIRYF